MENQEKAKQLVNLFYQPLASLKCGVSKDEMWEYSKKSALILIKELIEICPDLTKQGLSNQQLPVKDTQFVSYWHLIQAEVDKLNMEREFIGLPGGINFTRKKYFNVQSMEEAKVIESEILEGHGRWVEQFDEETKTCIIKIWHE